MTSKERFVREAKDAVCPGMPGEHLLRHDNRCDRLQLYRELALLGDAGRLSFVAWCCRLAAGLPPPQVCPRGVPGGRVDYPCDDAVADCLALTVQYGVPAPVILQELNRLARIQGK